eukprot:6413-Heterococcus_DN1.PRE.1
MQDYGSSWQSRCERYKISLMLVGLDTASNERAAALAASAHRFHALAMLQHLTFNERALGADASDLCLSVLLAHSHEARRGTQLKLSAPLLPIGDA